VDNGITVFDWVLIAVTLLLLALLWFIYKKRSDLIHKKNLAEFKSSMVPPPSSDDSKYLDMINEFPRK
jgi:hypothetical protein